MASSTNTGEDLWAEAFLSLHQENKSFGAGMSILSDRNSTVESVLSLVINTEKALRQKRWTFKNPKNGQTIIIRDVLTKMVGWINKFKAAGDVITQFDPGHAAIPWGLTRFVLQAVVNDIEMEAWMLEGLELVFKLAAQFKVVERLYLHRASIIQPKLRDAIVQLYSDILEYLHAAYQYYRQSTFRRAVRSITRLNDATKGHLDSIREKQGDIEILLHLIDGEDIMNTNTTLTSFSSELIQDIEAVNISIQNSDSRNKQTSTMLGQSIADLQQMLQEIRGPLHRACTQLSVIEDNLTVEERLKIFDWLSPIQYTLHHRMKTKVLMPNSGNWLLEKPEFLEWLGSSSSAILWLHGIPGSGKSMLVARVIDYLTELATVPVAYFYCARNSNEPERSDPTIVLRSILEQLCSSNEDTPIREAVARYYKEQQRDSKGRKVVSLDMGDTVQLTLKILSETPAYILIDGLDECQPNRRQECLNAFRTLIRESNNVVKIFVSSRDDHDLVHRLSQTPNIYIRASDSFKDLTRFIRLQVEEEIRSERILCGKVSRDLRLLIESTLITKSQGMFRLASLHIENLCDPYLIKTESNILATLHNLPTELRKSYDTIMLQIAHSVEPNPMVADRTMKWLLCMREVMSSKSFVFAIASTDPRWSQITNTDILSICCNLVVYDDEADCFRFAHLSVQEYLQGLEQFVPKISCALIAEQCLSWMSRSDTQQAEWYWPFQSPSAVHIDEFQHHVDLWWGTYTELAGELRDRNSLKLLLGNFLLPSECEPYAGSTALKCWTKRMLPFLGNFNTTTNLVIAVNGAVFSEVNFALNTLMVSCAFGFTELAATILRCKRPLQPLLASMDTRNLKWRDLPPSMTCAQVAAYCDQPNVLEVIREASQHVQLPAIELLDYWQRALQCARSPLVLKVLLKGAIAELVTESAVVAFLTGPCRADHKKEMLKLLLDHGGGQLSQSILDASLQSRVYMGEFVEMCLERLDSVHITKENLESTLYKHSGTIEAIIKARRKVRIDSAAVEVIFSGQGYLGLESFKPWELFDVEETIWRYVAASRDLKRKVDFFQDPGTFSVNSDEIVTQALRTGLKPDFVFSLLARCVPPFKLEYVHLVKASREKQIGYELIYYLAAVFEVEMSGASILLLISEWDLNMVEGALAARKIEVTDEVIRAAAGNFHHGKGIMEFLLKKELEAMEAC